MDDPEIRSLTREARRHRRLAPHAACDECGTTRHLAEHAGRVLCYGCLQVARGRGPAELDHVAGQKNLGGLLVWLRNNDHRTVTEIRLQLGIDTWPDADGDPLVTLAHVLAGLASLLFLLAQWLIDLAVDATSRLGPEIWRGAPPAPVLS